jgi:hypothetical protein
MAKFPCPNDIGRASPLHRRIVEDVREAVFTEP